MKRRNAALLVPGWRYTSEVTAARRSHRCHPASSLEGNQQLEVCIDAVTAWSQRYRVWSTNYCIFHVTLPPPQFLLLLWSIFEVLILTQFLMNYFKTLYIVFYVFYLDAAPTTSPYFTSLNFRFFMLSPQVPTIIECLPFTLECVSCPEKIHISPPVCTSDA